MAHVAIETLKNQIDEYVQRARQGERIVVTDRDLPVAVLTGTGEDLETHLARKLVDSGVASWSGGKPEPLSDPPKIVGRSTSDIVLEDRG